jgi:hypothetical protein
MAEPKVHVLESSHDTISSGTLDPTRPPALSVDSGDIVSCPTPAAANAASCRESPPGESKPGARRS